MNDIDPRMNDGAVSIYENDANDGFPVLKAFQQYIDAEQAKARKRMLMLSVFFGFVMTVVIAVFVLLLVSTNARNQALNDRLVEYAMKDRDRSAGPVVVQPTQDNSAILALANKLEEMKKSLAEERTQSAKENAGSPNNLGANSPSAEALEIQRLKDLLAAEKEKVSAEREKQRQLELETYRREHYPELYGERRKRPVQRTRQALQRESDEADREIESIIEEISAVSYFDDEEDEDKEIRAQPKRTSGTKGGNAEKNSPSAPKEEENFVIPVDVKDSSGGSWAIPND